MVFTELRLKGSFIIETERIEDERGFFARAWCKREFQSSGLVSSVVQANISFNKKAGTLRGMHYQAAPCSETKIVRCVSGAVYDVVIDLRPESATYLEWVGAILTEENCRALYVPENFAHGYLTLLDNSTVAYLVSKFYSPIHERGIRWDDPVFSINWPAPVTVISAKDKGWPDYKGVNKGR